MNACRDKDAFFSFFFKKRSQYSTLDRKGTTDWSTSLYILQKESQSVLKQVTVFLFIYFLLEASLV